MLRPLLSRIASTLHRRRVEQEFEQEIESHLRLLAERFMRQGMSEDEAMQAARRQFGGVTQMKEELRDRRALPPWDLLLRDIRHAFRQLRKARAFTASAALTLALGIGVSTAVFAVLNAVVLRPLPYPQPDRLMAFRLMDRRGVPHPTNFSYPTFFDFRRQNRAFEQLVSYRDNRFTLTDSLPAIQVAGQVVSWNLFPLLGVSVERGRPFRADDERPGTHVVVLSHELWVSRFGADSQIPGKQIHINGRLYTVAGVTPPGFHFPVDDPAAELWTTLADDAAISEFTPLTEQRGARVLDVIGRLRPGVTPRQAEAQMDQVAAALAAQYPDENKNTPTTLVVPELQRLTGGSAGPLWILLGAVGLVLLIGCANVVNLLLVRSIERAREFALRTALGASRRALLQQLFAESLFIGLLGSAGGVLLAGLAVRGILSMAGDSIPIARFSESGLDFRVLMFAILTAIATTVLFSLAPAAHVLRVDPAGALKESAANIARGRHGLRNALVVVQISCGLVLLVGAELLIANLASLLRRDPGFQPDHLLTFEIGLSETRYNTASSVAFCDRLLERLRAIPGVRGAATGTPLPLEGDQMSVSFDIEERPLPPADRQHSDMSIVTPGFFAVMGIPVIEGRDFTERDDTNAPRVVIVNEAFARKYFPGEDALGKRIEPGATNGKEGMRMREIVGVVRNAKQVSFTADPDAIYYFPYKQLSWGIGTIVLRTAVPPDQVQRAARAALTGLDHEAPMYRIQTGEERAATAVTGPRFLTVLMASFAAIALLLTIVGLYGVLSYTVARRRREIGVRIAMGAGRREVLSMVLRDAVRLLVPGLLLGTAGAAGAERLLAGLTFGVHPGDPVFLLMACGVMALTSLAAAYAPALRAVSVDPMQALRVE